MLFFVLIVAASDYVDDFITIVIITFDVDYDIVVVDVDDTYIMLLVVVDCCCCCCCCCFFCVNFAERVLFAIFIDIVVNILVKVV